MEFCIDGRSECAGEMSQHPTVESTFVMIFVGAVGTVRKLKCHILTWVQFLKLSQDICSNVYRRTSGIMIKLSAISRKLDSRHRLVLHIPWQRAG